MQGSEHILVVLPKNFDPVLLNARIDSSLVKKRNRDKEQEYFKQVGRLTDAAGILESGLINPARLNLEDMTRREDALGNLARVFTRMATQVYERERKLNQQVRTLKGIGLLLAVGIVTGLGVVLSRIASIESPHPFGNVLWVNAVCALVCFGTVLVRGKMPKIDKNLLSTVFLWALCTAIMGEAVIFWVAQHLQASYIALILVCEGFIVFAFASVIKIEKATMRRLTGFVVGAAGVAILLYGIVSATGVSMRVHLVGTAGAVFSSQASFVITFAGIAWSIILLGETLPGVAWGALAMLVVGLLLVGPKEEAEEVDPLSVRIDHEL